MNIVYYEKVKSNKLPANAIAETYLACVIVDDIKKCAEQLVNDISNTSWIERLDAIGRMSYEKTALRTIESLVAMFGLIQNDVTKDFGEFMISMNSGRCLSERSDHMVLPLSELWKEKLCNNHGFDFHTVSPAQKFSFGEAKFVSSGNSYPAAAEQVIRFIEEGKDSLDAVHLQKLSEDAVLDNLKIGKRGFTVAFSINSENHINILHNSLKNKHILDLCCQCDELYIIGVKYEARGAD